MFHDLIYKKKEIEKLLLIPKWEIQLFQQHHQHNHNDIYSEIMCKNVQLRSTLIVILFLIGVFEMSYVPNLYEFNN